MHSKWKIWDFLKARPEVLSSDKKVIALYCFDPIAFKIIKESINYKNYFAEEKLHVVLGKEITSQWFDDQYKSLGLFGNEDSFLVHFAQEMPVNIKEEFQNIDQLLLDNRFLLLNFTKEDKFFKQLTKLDNEKLEVIQITAPAFWEDGELLDFVCHLDGVYLTIAAKDKIKESIPFQLESYYQLIQQVKINFPNQQNIDVEDVLPLLFEAKVDHFELANLLGLKKMSPFYQKLIAQYTSGADMLGAFYFLQSHFIKMYDPSFLDQKNRLSKYDKQIVSHAKIWNKDEIIRGLNYLGDLTVKLKQKDPRFELEIKSGRLRTFNF